MSILIDGFNVIYKIPELEGYMYKDKLSKAMNGLIRKLNNYNLIKKEKIVVFFDGKKRQSDRISREEVKGIDVFYSHDYSADSLIKEYIKKNINPKMLTVVTSDNDIRAFARDFRSKLIKSEDFVKLLDKTISNDIQKKGEDKDTNPVLSDREVEYWEKMFKKK